MLREQLASPSSNVVVKLGSQVLVSPAGGLDGAFLADMARQVAGAVQAGWRVTLVSSGAIAAGSAALGLSQRPRDLAKLQAVAAVGQRLLMDAWGEAFSAVGLAVAQVLLTREDMDKRVRFLNTRNTIHAAQDLKAVPIVNENDTVSTDEIVRISFGDNDLLAATVAQALRADVLVLLSVVPGLQGPDGKVVPEVARLSDVADLVRADRSAAGRGGMGSKLEAAKLVTAAGERLVIAAGREPEVLSRILSGERVGTTFLPAAGGRRAGRSRWISAARTAGAILVDAGAAKALAGGRASLLPAGVVGVEGSFGRGDPVLVRTEGGEAVARGLTNYAAEAVRQVAGKKTAEVRKLLGEGAYDEIIHRDNLLLVKGL
ncbi:MAG: glutamate 5-kinase [Phycisphaerae bacterium]